MLQGNRDEDGNERKFGDAKYRRPRWRFTHETFFLPSRVIFKGNISFACDGYTGVPSLVSSLFVQASAKRDSRDWRIIRLRAALHQV